MAQQLQLGDDGSVISCKRCGASCRFDPYAPRNPDPKPITLGASGGQMTALRRSLVPEGLCGTCAVREWFYYMRHDLPVEVKPDALLLPHVQQQFAAIMQVTGADITPGEINWQKLVDEWDLPIPSAGKGHDRRLRKMDDDPMWQKDPPARVIDMRPGKRGRDDGGVDELAQARAAKKHGRPN